MTTEEAIAASSMDSLSEAPEERAVARFAVTASPAPTLPCLENLCGALADLVEDAFRTGRGGRIGREQDVCDAGQAVALDQGAHVEAAEIQRQGVHRPRINSRSGAASRKSGITTSAPTPESRSRFHSSIRPEPLLASSLATATARPPASLVFSIST